MTLTHKVAFRETMLTLDEESGLVDRYRTDGCRKSLDRLVRTHARMAFSVARRWSNNEAHMQDLAQEGMIGIMKAADKFNPSFGKRFAQYCRWWILSSISSKASEVVCVVDMPDRVFIAHRRKRLEGDDAAIVGAAVNSLSISEPLSGEEGSATIGDTLVSEEASPETEALRSQTNLYFRQAVEKAMEGLNDREREILRRRRLTDTQETLEDIAAGFDLTRERIRQIENAAMRKVERNLREAGFRPEELEDLGA
ncbi:sigma-70 family RNA polymerase sigma factor [Methylobacterium brachiatum]